MPVGCGRGPLVLYGGSSALVIRGGVVVVYGGLLWMRGRLLCGGGAGVMSIRGPEGRRRHGMPRWTVAVRLVATIYIM
ncbi:hypothetical protein K443DRAFT_4098 [Laccaria amethystina LaAM-08-1]|uniref:Unplaced genomic scaffold K443scaffold_28, whole genome shotgun sequence n=1 Tax=Laccaria amethystina LaAM-08-1 TaxID=1095629 RepID=A0A0C9Y4P5_9AGAR|nr:hypothetical protein K443DRAFT_4098 [Laccaria amethystina LaAM-08-1]